MAFHDYYLTSTFLDVMLAKYMFNGLIKVSFLTVLDS